jgi:hypothetical protein
MELIGMAQNVLSYPDIVTRYHAIVENVARKNLLYVI